MPAPSISALPTPPSRSSSPDTFSNDADAFLGALPTFRTEANAQASYLDGVAAAVDADAAAAQAARVGAETAETNAELAATIANATANYQGDYSAGTTYQIGDSVLYSGSLWMAKTVNTGVTPVAGANWYLIPGGDVTLTGTQTLTNKTLTGPIIDAAKSTVNAVAASAIDCAVGSYFTKTASGALSWTVTNVPASGAFSFILELTNGGTGTQTWFSGTKWPGGVAPTLTTSGVDVLGFITDDGGTTWRGVLLMKDSR